MSMQTLFDNATRIPTIPKVIQELIQAFRTDNTSADYIGDTLAKDPALTAKVLRLANSAHFGGNRQISSCNDATVLLGLGTLQTLVMASGITGALQLPEGIEQKSFWQRSFDIASICKWLAVRAKNQDKDTAFTCGMLYQIGLILIAMEHPETVQKIDQAVANGAQRNLLEHNELGYSSNEVSAELANRWHFPEPFVQALKSQDEPEQAVDDDGLAALLHIAKFIHQHRQSDDGKTSIVDNFPMDIANQAGLDCAQVLAEIDEVIELKSDLAELID